MSDELQCPHCGEVPIEPMESPSSMPWNDGDSEEIECASCGKELSVVCQVTKIEWKFVDENWNDIEFEA